MRVTRAVITPEQIAAVIGQVQPLTRLDSSGDVRLKASQPSQPCSRVFFPFQK